MNNKYTPGQDCGCHAYYEGECGFGADRVPSEVYELREKLAAERAIADRLAEELSSLLSPLQTTNALAAWKEARND